MIAGGAIIPVIGDSSESDGESSDSRSVLRTPCLKTSFEQHVLQLYQLILAPVVFLYENCVVHFLSTFILQTAKNDRVWAILDLLPVRKSDTCNG